MTQQNEFEDRMARLIDERINKFVSENLEQYFGQIANAVETNVTKKMTGELQQIRDLITSGSATPGGDGVQASAEMGQAASQERTRGKEIVESLFRDPDKWIDRLFKVHDRFRGRDLPSQLLGNPQLIQDNAPMLLRILNQVAPEQFGLYQMSPWGPATQRLMMNSLNMGLKIGSAARQPRNLGRDLFKGISSVPDGPAEDPRQSAQMPEVVQI